eukprot:GHVQ01037278.1.p1 GENE.GHVQ01037278.1~~GHVQ01037278.1.p1  ORF type:complete len:205 (+),score=15.27 GHVQ01037278.1:441-1055(+)
MFTFNRPLPTPQTSTSTITMSSVTHPLSILPGTVAWSLTLIAFWASTHFFDTAWLSRELGSGSGWLLFFTARLCDAFSVILIGCGIFFMECYHSDGAGEPWGWLAVTLFKFTFLAEIVGLALYNSPGHAIADMVYTVLFGCSLLIGFLWSLFFEPTVHRYDVKLTQSAMRNEYYKSRNAMAYYGPAVVTADGQIDMSQMQSGRG